ncbi:MAG: TAXI family TRAP transporter solute-binding subunit [Deltaproteobacteria bacterium]|nr:TAXI family TRAP transporter solute-binding subunit [Deltaproteobacteria bacterium]
MMVSRKNLSLLAWGLALASGSILGIFGPAVGQISLPKMMTWTAYDVGSSGYMQVGFISEALWEKYKIKIRIIPAGTDLPRVYPLRLKDADVAFHGVGSYFMQEGLHDYSTMDWGPQPVRALYLAQHAGLCFGVRGDSGIQTASDLKGKRVAYFPTYALTMISEAHLVFAGLTWADVKRVDVPAYAAGMKMVMEGKIDAAHINPTASFAYEFAAMPFGLRYVSLPFADKEGWARLKKHAPMYSPMKATIGAGLSAEKPLETLTYAYPVALAYDFLPSEKAYIVSKLLYETFPIYAPKHKSLEAYWPLEKFLELLEDYPLPLHEGTIRYLKEIGKWTPEREAMNKERLKRQAELKKLWDAVVAEALEKKIKGDDFPKFWLGKRAAAGF